MSMHRPTKPHCAHRTSKSDQPSGWATRFNLELRKWRQTVFTSWSKLMAYRTSFLLFAVGPLLVYLAIKYSLWHSIFTLGGHTELSGYTRDDMLTYQCWSFVVALLVQMRTTHTIAEDIRLGRISSYLIYPFAFWKFHTAHYLAHLMLQVGVVVVVFGLLAKTAILPRVPSLEHILAGFWLCLLASTLWFLLTFSFGLAAFWLEETWVFQAILSNLTALLAGSLIPLEFFPQVLADALMFTPFPYLNYVPIQLFMANDVDALPVITIIMLVWIALAAAFVGFIWKRGLSLYTAAGM